jgi:Glycosyl hydrolases family 18
MRFLVTASILLTMCQCMGICSSSNSTTVNGGGSNASPQPQQSNASGGACTSVQGIVNVQGGANCSPAPSSGSPGSPSSSAGLGGSGNPSPTNAGLSSPAPAGSSGPAVSVGSFQLVGFWESWGTLPLTSVPSVVTTTDIAFSTTLANGTLGAPQNSSPLAPGASAIHANGGKVLISFGGYTARNVYANLDPATFATDLAAFFAANPGVYDGIDFDDEIDPPNPQTLINVITATRAAMPNIVITLDALKSGADPGSGTDQYQGSDIPVAAALAQSINWVNVMDYDLYNDQKVAWKPSTNPNCEPTPGASDDCYKDVIVQFAKIFPANKIVMGLMVPQDDAGAPMTAANVGAYAQWVKSNGYRGIMLWDINRDSGFSAINAAAAGL